MSSSTNISITQQTVLRILCLGVGILMVSGSGPVFGFYNYATAVKATFNLTQSELELCATLMNFGNRMALPAGILGERVGFRILSVVAAVLSFVSWILLFVGTKSPAFFAGSVWPLGILFFFTGCAAVTAFIAAAPVNFDNFTKKRRGCVVSMLEFGYNVAPAFSGIIYYSAYVGDFLRTPEDQNLSGFFLLQAVTWGAVFATGAVFLRQCPPEVEGEALQLVEKDSGMSSISSETSSGGFPPDTSPSAPSYQRTVTSPKLLAAMRASPHDSVSGTRLLLDVEFQLFAWSFIIFTGVQGLYINNLTTLLASYTLYECLTVAALLPPAMACIALLVVGPLSDYTAATAPRVLYLLIFHVLMVMVFVIVTLWGDSAAGQYMGMIGVSMGSGVIYCMSPTILSEAYGLYYFGRNWGGICLGSAVATGIFQALLGVFYEANIDTAADELSCFGSACYYNTFVICICAMCLGLVLDIALVYRQVRRYTDYYNPAPLTTELHGDI